MFTLSAFADEISPNPREQLAILASCGVRFIELRSIDGINVLALTDDRIRELRTMLADGGFGISAIGSPIGKLPIDAGFSPHLDRFKRALELCAVFGTTNIRIFSYYPPADAPFDGDWSPWRSAIIDRTRAIAELAETAKITLFHENEHRIYGDSPERVRDLITAVASPSLQAAYDAANYVVCGYDPLDAWHATKSLTGHLHIKDWKTGGEHGVLAGCGDGRIDISTADAVARGYSGFAVLEPHLRGGGPTGGQTGADLFPVAVEAFRKILKAAGGVEKMG